jgi:hypothetical protein
VKRHHGSDERPLLSVPLLGVPLSTVPPVFVAAGGCSEWPLRLGNEQTRDDSYVMAGMQLHGGRL